MSFELLLLHAAFVADEIWGFMLEPGRTLLPGTGAPVKFYVYESAELLRTVLVPGMYHIAFGIGYESRPSTKAILVVQESGLETHPPHSAKQ